MMAPGRSARNKRSTPGKSNSSISACERPRGCRSPAHSLADRTNSEPINPPAPVTQTNLPLIRLCCLNSHRFARGGGLVRRIDDFMAASGFIQTGERHIFALRQSLEKGFELRAVGMIRNVARIKQL